MYGNRSAGAEPRPKTEETTMKYTITRGAVTPFALSLWLALAVALPTSVFAIGGSRSSYVYETTEIEFYPNGQPKCMKGSARCASVKIVAQPTTQAEPEAGRSPHAGTRLQARPIRISNAAAYGHIALQLPIDATVVSFETFTDATLSSPLLINGELAVWSPATVVAAEAEAFAGPAQPGFVWRGFRTNPLLENVAGTFDQPFVWVASFDEGEYPDPGMIGAHSVAAYVSDNAESPDPLLYYITVY